MSEDKDPKSQVVKEIIATAKDDPDVQAAGRNLAKAARTVTEFINLALLPVSAANWGVERARKYFKEGFGSEFEPYVSNIPLENIKEPPSEIAGPALQGIAWSLDHDVLKDMFMRLLASAMDSRKVDASHPAFVRVVQQLSPDEADLLNKIFNALSPEGALPIVCLRVETAGTPGYQERARHIARLSDDETGEPSSLENFPFWLDNWQRLGVVEVRYDTFIHPAKDAYSWVVDERPEYRDLKSTLSDDQTIEVKNGLFRLTAFGSRLAEALR